ncbi:helix-turn-helix domain-containing protein [Pseudomonas rhizoryzae]|uniref:helix-turn-helix domain-containing protein n=1 Tax=Pseudomonas rhizoryzae TaxID=2571129 RepID=UPI0007378234|nr:helix-turn-helix domain-containing protein [Pseudomonas rhizoryzae]KTT28116.1 MerR family transcriptional regulator [Pseudomonas psychrotolerans]KTT37024.1 MerR family transcriptional regulator [Pseudomonas psychrotolerans]KTT75631.1 MerR family transcriptional regulator [Pseudomonas psychrotolerans]
MDTLDIGEVVRRSGVAASTLRYYEEIGLVASCSRSGLRRQFPAKVLVQLQLISMGKMAGFSLQDLVTLFGEQHENPNIPRDELRRKAADIDQQIRTLSALRETLLHVADCPAPSHLDCPTFRRLMDLSGRQARRGLSRKTPW